MPCGAQRDVEANGLRLRLYEWGLPGRPPALLLHSLAAHSHWWDWSAALDRRGHGGSAWSDPPAYRAADYAADIVAVLDALGWRRPLVVGHSLGGYVGAYLAARYPERVGALVIADTMTQ